MKSGLHNILRVLLAVGIFHCGIGHAQQLLYPSMMSNAQQVPQLVQDDSPEVIEWQETIKTCIKLLTKIDVIIEDIIIMLSKGLFKIRHENKEEVKRRIADTRMNVMAILHDQTNFLKVKKIDDLKRYCAYLIVLIEKLLIHLDRIVNSGFKTVPAFDFDLLRKKKIKTNISLKEVKNKLVRLASMATDVHRKEEYANLRWYNILTRRFENSVVGPWHKYQMGTVLKVSCVTIGTALVTLWYLGSNYLQNKYQSERRVFFAEASYSSLKQEFDGKSGMPSFKCKVQFKKGDLLNALDQRGYLSTQAPVCGHQTDGAGSVEYLQQSDINFIEKAFRKYFEEVLVQNSSLSWFLNKLPSFFGDVEPGSYNGIDYELKAQRGPERYTIVSSVMHLVDNVVRSQYATISLLGSFAWGTYQQVWGDGNPGTLSAYIQEKRFDLWNFLRGGAHLQQSISLDFNPTLTFDDVIGMDEVKEELKFLLAFIESPEIFIRSNKIPERGYLFTGPTRSGKSYIVEALCGEIARLLQRLGRGKEFKFRKIPPFLITNLGIERILHWAKTEAPIILWIDEIDLLDLQRVGDKKTLMAFLTGMGNSFDNDPNKLVIIIGCTNRPENMDHALKQYGRFGKEIRFEYPSAEYRKKFIIRQLQSMGLDPRYFDIEALTYKTEGCQFEQIKAFIKSASVKAWMYGKVIDQNFLDESFDTEIRHILPVERKALSDTEREILATYFAGKALAHALLDTRGELDRVTIRPIMVKLEETWVYEDLTDKEKQAKGDDHKIQYGQVFTKYVRDTAKINTYEQTFNEIKLLLAGYAAEQVMFGVSTYSCHPEDSMAAYKAAEAIAFEGLDRKRIGKKQVAECAQRSYELRKRCQEEIKELLEQYKPALIKLIEALKEKSTLSDSEVMFIIEEAMMADQEQKGQLDSSANDDSESESDDIIGASDSDSYVVGGKADVVQSYNNTEAMAIEAV